jgi:hypothetical protein
MGRRSTVVAWSMLAIYAAGLAGTAVFAVLSGSITGTSNYTLYLPAFTAFMVVGALVVAHRPGNAIGWISRPSRCCRSVRPWPVSTSSTPM